MFTNNPILNKKKILRMGGGRGGGRGEQEGVLGKVNYFYKESKSNIKEKKLGGGGGGERVGVGNDGWRGLELVIFFNYETKFKIK